jgi:hypothetical protein
MLMHDGKKIELSTLLTPPAPNNMELALCRQTKEEGITPGLRVFRGSTPGQNILVNASISNYTVTNRYVEGSNSVLKKEKRELTRELTECKKKYDVTKKMLKDAAYLVSFLSPKMLDITTRLKLVEFNTKWERMYNKRSTSEDDDDEEDDEDGEDEDEIRHTKKKRKYKK